MTIVLDIRSITDYGDLLHEIEPRTIRTEEQWARYTEIIDVLIDIRPISLGQHEMVGLLGQLVYDWEQEHEEPITATPQEIVRHLLEANGLSQSALVPAVFPARQNVSEFLAGRRGLSVARITKLATYFHLPPKVFLPHYVRRTPTSR